MSFSSVSVVGAGSWGSALASLLAGNGIQTTLVGRKQSDIDQINQLRENKRYLPGVQLSSELEASTSLEILEASDLILLVVPTSAYRQTCEEIAKLNIPTSTVFLSCSKGIERESGIRMSEIVEECLPDNPSAALSGPNHAEEVARKLATCAVIGAKDDEIALRLQQAFANQYFRCYRQDDVAGIELGGAIKNVFAIAAGIAIGLGLGDNAASALVTRGLAEMIRLGSALGGEKDTFIGLSGVGDLVATCYSVHSRNYRVGKLIGGGMSRDEAVETLGMVAEGVPNTLSIYETARKFNINTPLIDATYAILYKGKNPTHALQELLTRDPKHEKA